MLRSLFIVCIALLTTGACAGSGTCSLLATQVDSPENNFRPPAEAVVIGNGELPFFEAPSVNCKIKGTFAVPGSYLTLYKIYKGWANVMFIAQDGQDIIAWVPTNRLKIVGQYGSNH